MREVDLRVHTPDNVAMLRDLGYDDNLLAIEVSYTGMPGPRRYLDLYAFRPPIEFQPL
jgi:hypothetical protein